MNQKQIILTGDRPTGKLHIGHYASSLRSRVALQASGTFDEIYIMIADTQALTDNAYNFEKIRNNILNVALDYLGCGIDPHKCHIFIQSQVPELFELTAYYMNFVSVSRVSRNPTIKEEIKMRHFDSQMPMGFLNYPISQAADITAFDATCVPCGDDQLPMIELTNEIVHTFNRLYGDVLVKTAAKLSDNQVSNRLPGTDGKAKMSKSLNNCIFLADDAATVEKKIMSMYTDPLHLKVSDPGNCENNPVFIYLEAFCSPEHFQRYLPEYPDLAALKAHYERGGLGDMKVKRFLNQVMQDTLEPIRQRRAYYEQRPEEVRQILIEGSLAARAKAQKTLERVRAAMKINYFDDPSVFYQTES